MKCSCIQMFFVSLQNKFTGRVSLLSDDAPITTVFGTSQEKTINNEQ